MEETPASQKMAKIDLINSLEKLSSGRSLLLFDIILSTSGMFLHKL